MTLLAGIWGRRSDQAIPDSLCDALRGAMSRNSTEEVAVFRDQRVCLLKIDIGAYGSPAFRVDPNGSVSMLAGEPLLQTTDDSMPLRRANDLHSLSKRWNIGDWDLLRQTHGAFCAVHYRSGSPQLLLVTDKLGLRPLYYWVGPHHVVFAGALRILEAVPEVARTMDLRAVTEIASFGYELENRTPYQEIRSLRPAEIVIADGDSLSSRKYWRWDGIPQSEKPEPQLLKDVHSEFMRAVARRLRSDTTTVALLSGGLDSRCVVAALRGLGARVHTLNCSFPGSQDQVFAAEYARKAETLHDELDIQVGTPDFFQALERKWRVSKNRQEWPVERPHLVWTGNDGDVSVGHLWMSEAVVSLLRAGRVGAAIDRFLNEQKKKVISRLLHHNVRPFLLETLRAGMRAELSDLHCADAGRNLYVFLMVNNMRKHLMKHLENIDVHRIELQVPFCDGAFLESMLAVPLDSCLHHRFYTKWLYVFQPEVTQVPWQAYPGSEPCPLPIPSGLAYQWNPKNFKAEMAAEKKQLLHRSRQLLAAGEFPDGILDRSFFKAAWMTYGLGLRDYGYVLKAAMTYQRYWRACAGNFALPSPPRHE